MDNKREKRRKYGIFTAILFGIAVLSLGIWQSTEIKFKNNNYYTEEELNKAVQVDKLNILDLPLKKMKKRLLELPYIKEVDMSYHFPLTIVISITEYHPIAYVPFQGNYLCIDEEGTVIEQVIKPIIKQPIIKGLIFDRFKVGEKLQVTNDDGLLAGIDIIVKLEKHKYKEKVHTIDITDLAQIHLYVNNLDGIIGDIGDFDKKLQWLIQVAQQYDMGVLDLSTIENGQAILKPLT